MSHYVLFEKFDCRRFLGLNWDSLGEFGLYHARPKIGKLHNLAILNTILWTIDAVIRHRDMIVQGSCYVFELRCLSDRYDRERQDSGLIRGSTSPTRQGPLQCLSQMYAAGFVAMKINCVSWTMCHPEPLNECRRHLRISRNRSQNFSRPPTRSPILAKFQEVARYEPFHGFFFFFLRSTDELMKYKNYFAHSLVVVN